MSFAVLACNFAGERAEPGPDGGEPDAGVEPTGPCGSPGALVSSFEPGDEGLFFSAGVRTNLALDGSLTVTAPNDNFETVSTNYGVKLEGRAIDIEVVSPMIGGGEARFVVSGTNNDTFAFVFRDGSIATATRVGGSQSATSSGSFDEARHRHLRIRESSGTVFLETSGTGATDSFAVMAEVTAAVTAPVLARLEVVGSAAAGEGGSMVIDNLNAFAEPARWCAPSDFADDFEDGELDANWVRLNGDRCDGDFENSGDARFDQDTGGGFTFCTNRAIAGYDLRAGPVSFEALTISDAAGTGWRALLSAVSPDGEIARISWVGDTVCGDIGSGTDICIPYDADLMNFFRIAMPQDDVVQFETSPDAQTWNTVAEHPAPFSGRHVSLRIGTESSDLAVDKPFRVESYNLD